MPQRNHLLNHAASILGLLFVAIVAISMNAAFKPIPPVMSYILPSGIWSYDADTLTNEFYGFKNEDCGLLDEYTAGKAVINDQVISDGIILNWLNPSKSSAPTGLYVIGGVEWTSIYSIDSIDKIGMDLTHECNSRKIESSYWFALPAIKDRVYKND